MDKDKHDPNDHDNDHGYLFDELDRIMSDANDSEIETILDEEERRALVAEREAAMIEAIGRILDDDTAVAFDTLYGKTIDRQREASALEVAYALADYVESADLDDEQAGRMAVVASLNRIVMDASFTELTDDGFYRDAIPKQDLQLAILTDDALPAPLKRRLIGVIDRELPGASLDTSEPDAVARALREREEALNRLFGRD